MWVCVRREWCVMCGVCVGVCDVCVVCWCKWGGGGGVMQSMPRRERQAGKACISRLPPWADSARGGCEVAEARGS